MNQLAELFGRLDILYNSGLSNSFLLLSRSYVCKSMDNSVKLMHSMNQLAELFGRLDILYNSGLSNSFLLLSRSYVCKSMDNSVKLTPTFSLFRYFDIVATM